MWDLGVSKDRVHIRQQEYKGFNNAEARSRQRAQMAERTLIRPSHSPLPLGKLKPKEDSVFPKATVPLSRVHAPSKGFSCLGSEVQTERMRIRSSGFCVTRSGVLVS